MRDFGRIELRGSGRSFEWPWQACETKDRAARSKRDALPTTRSSKMRIP